MLTAQPSAGGQGREVAKAVDEAGTRLRLTNSTAT
jgi:hypothetical protein